MQIPHRSRSSKCRIHHTIIRRYLFDRSILSIPARKSKLARSLTENLDSLRKNEILPNNCDSKRLQNKTRILSLQILLFLIQIFNGYKKKAWNEKDSEERGPLQAKLRRGGLLLSKLHFYWVKFTFTPTDSLMFHFRSYIWNFPISQYFGLSCASE